MKILSLETSSKLCAVALTEDEHVLQEKIIEDENTHSVTLMPLINDLLEENNTFLLDVDLFACDIGPGSFTGIRIGVATIKAFLDVTHKKAVGVTSLETLAYNVQAKENEIVCSLIDAKNENVYVGFFEKVEKEYFSVQEVKFASVQEAIKMAKAQNKKIIFVGNGSIAYQDVIQSNIENATIIEGESNKLNARNIALIAYRKSKEAVDSHHLRPMYLRQSNAER